MAKRDAGECGSGRGRGIGEGDEGVYKVLEKRENRESGERLYRGSFSVLMVELHYSPENNTRYMNTPRWSKPINKIINNLRGYLSISNIKLIRAYLIFTLI